MVVKRREWMDMKHKIMLESINSDINQLKSIQSHDYYSIQPILHVFNSHNKKASAMFKNIPHGRHIYIPTTTKNTYSYKWMNIVGNSRGKWCCYGHEFSSIRKSILIHVPSIISYTHTHISFIMQFHAQFHINI